MLKNCDSLWSKNLQAQTREAIQELPISLDGNLHFKHLSNVFAYAALTDLLIGQIVLYSKSDECEYRFDSADDLIQAGWVID